MSDDYRRGALGGFQPVPLDLQHSLLEQQAEEDAANESRKAVQGMAAARVQNILNTKQENFTPAQHHLTQEMMRFMEQGPRATQLPKRGGFRIPTAGRKPIR